MGGSHDWSTNLGCRAVFYLCNSPVDGAQGVNRVFLEMSAKTQKGADLAIRKESWQFPKTGVNYSTGKNIDRLELAWRANQTAE